MKRLINKISALSITAAMLIGMQTANGVFVSAAQIDDAVGAKSGVTGDCTWRLSSGVLTISGNGAIYHCSQIKDLLFPDGLLEIDDLAMADCYKLKRVKIPASVTSIGANALGYDDKRGGSGYWPIEDFKIEGYADTAAQAYAQKNGFQFVELN